MARRYSQVKRGAEYEVALDNYVQYLQNAQTRPSKRLQGGIRGARRVTVAASVRPFGIDLSVAPFVQIRVGQESLTEMTPSVGTRLFTTGANLTAAVKLNKFRPAKASAFRGTGAATYVQSKVTKLYYLKYTGDSFNIPFGALSETEEEYAGSAAVKAAILSQFGAADIKRISISPEKVPV